MTHHELLKQALEALEDLGMKHYQNTGEVLYGDVYEALKSAITEPEFPRGQATTDVGVPVYVVKKAEPDLIRLQHNIMKTALEQIAGTRAIIDNLLSDKDIARITLDRIRLQDEHSTGLRPTP